MIYHGLTGRDLAWIAIIVALIALFIVPAFADDIFHDRSGNVVGRSRTDSNGTTTFYTRSGNVTGSARVDSNGVTTFHDRAGNVTGTARLTR